VAGARRRWGWHRLAEDWAERIVEGAGVVPGDLVLDVGAGDGALTAPLLARGAKVVAVEAHPGRRTQLRRRFAGQYDGRLVVVAADAADLRLPRRPFRVVASPPYGVTAPLLCRLLHPGSRLRSADLVLQEQAVRRWTTTRTSHWDLQRGMRVPRRAFTPPPRVDSRVLVIRRVDG